MSKKKIYILTGPIRSGKTTMLLNWSSTKNNINGILTPIINEKRFFVDAHSREQFAMEANESDKHIIKVGRYVFNKLAFEKASNVIKNSLDKSGWLIIDEIGPLELSNNGFSEILHITLNSKNERMNILLVVREGLLEIVKDNYQLNTAMVITNISSLLNTYDI